MASFKEGGIQNNTSKNTALTKREIRRQILLRQVCYKHETYRTQPKVYKILKQISTDIKETAKIHGNVDESVFLQYHEKLWNTTNIKKQN
jgi:hypothetical protein